MIQEAVRRRLLLTTLLVVSLSVAACQRSGRQAGPTVSVPASGAAAGATALGGPVPASASSAAASSARASSLPSSPSATPPGNSIVLGRQKPAGEPKIIAFSNPASLMALGRSKRLLPEDFKIGPLGDDRAGTSDQSSAMAAAEKFLASLVAGSLDTKLLATDSQSALVDSLTFEMQRGNEPQSFRLGAPKSRDNGEITATVRLFGDQSSSEGEIYMTSSGRQWVVADIQLSLGELAIKKEKSKDKYFPSEYRWLLEE